MKVVIDTNAYVDFCKGNKTIVDILTKAEKISFPLIVLAELRAGFACGNRSTQNEKNLIYFLNSPRVEILHPDEQTTHHYAQLFYQLRKQGTPIPTNDIWIAALAHQHNLRLVSRDCHYDHLPQLLRL